MRHATDDDLQRVAAFLARLRAEPELRERTPGSFSRGSRAFLHFHADREDIYVDVRLGGVFERVKVTTVEEQEELLARARRSLESQD
ncbi:MAG TPA: hypothetical protein VME20_05485 [Acidimicrobiales bacterium]|nr:hypothetical protein [Acidimicrobiales bacterium]HUB69194.1 hypothetical protein [Acidimicrobiales bacterium]